MKNDGRKYEVVNTRTGERFGNHTYNEAISRAAWMRRAWQYKEHFSVEEREK